MVFWGLIPQLGYMEPLGNNSGVTALRRMLSDSRAGLTSKPGSSKSDEFAAFLRFRGFRDEGLGLQGLGLWV